MPFMNKEVIILKPVPAFLKFLASHFPKDALPTLKKLEKNATVYVINKKENDEETLDEIERHFVSMFRHEIKKAMGKKANIDLGASFLDFLCCFKFELHTHLVMLEDSLLHAESVIRVKPRSFLFKWIGDTVPEGSGLCTVLDHVNLANLTEDATLIIRNCKNMIEVKQFLRQCYAVIFEAEMLRLSNTAEQWPQISSYPEFCRYFSFDFYKELILLD